VKFTYTPTNIVQSNEYYPFGLQTANSWTRDNTTNNFLYDAGSELNNSTGMYDLPFRNYDASLGRFFQVDPLATTSHAFTPYHYAGNNPIGANDPSGLVVQYYANPEDNPMNWRMTVHDYRCYGDDWSDAVMYQGNGGSGGGWDGVNSLLADIRSMDAQYMGLLDFVDKYGPSVAASYLSSRPDPNGVALIVPWGVRNGNTQNGIAGYSYYNILGKLLGYSWELSNIDGTGMTRLKGAETHVVDLEGGEIGDIQGASFFGSTSTIGVGREWNNFNDPIGTYVLGLSFTKYAGNVNDNNKRTLNLNHTLINNKYSANVSLDVGKFSYAVGLNSLSLSVMGVEISSGFSVLDGFSFGGSYTDSVNNISGFEASINPTKLVTVLAGAAVATAPYWGPVVAALSPIGL
jgi:RHS repeat-associated protein